MTRRGLLLFAAMCVIWGVPYLLIKVSVDEISPVLLVFFRTALGGALLLPVAFARGHVRPLLSAWRWVLVYTVVEVGIPWLMLSDAETSLSSSLSGLVLASVPLISAVLAIASGSESRLGLARLAGLLVGLGGVAALLGGDFHSGQLLALLEILVTAVGYATGPMIINRKLAALPSSGVIAASLVLTAVACAPWALTHLPATAPSAKVIASVLVLAVVCTAVAFLVFFALINEIGPSRATVITYVNPAVAVLLGVTLLNEAFTVATAIGFPLVLAGSYLATRRVSPRREAATPELHAADMAAVPSER